MVRDCAPPACCEEYGTAACMADARDHQRHLLCDALWLSVAPAAERFTSMEYDLSLVCDVPRRRARLDALAVDDCACGAGLASGPFAVKHDQGVIYFLEAPFVAERRKPAIDRTPWR